MTTKVIWIVWLAPVPVLTVTLKVEVPVGVPGFVGFEGPPLQATSPATEPMNSSASVVRQRFLEAALRLKRISMAMKNADTPTKPAGVVGGAFNRGTTLEGAMVATERFAVAVVVVLVSVTEAGEKLQLASEGNPTHDEDERLIVPAKPPVAENVSAVVPEPPGELIVIVDGLADTLKPGGVPTVTTTAGDFADWE